MKLIETFQTGNGKKGNNNRFSLAINNGYNQHNFLFQKLIGPFCQHEMFSSGSTEL